MQFSAPMTIVSDDSPLLPLKALTPDFTQENQLLTSGLRFVAGLDEAGRGPLAGPVVAACVILDPHDLPEGLDDSKRLNAKRRALLFDQILNKALAVSISSLCAQSIDQSNILAASLEAMRRSLVMSAIKPDHALIDGNKIPPHMPCPATALVKGDQRSLSIAAASIIAKVSRDRMMDQADKQYPTYGLAQHAGYGTAKHRQAIIDNGPVDGLHRFTFAPIKQVK